MASYEIEVGRLLCGTVRDFLGSQKAKGRDIRWHEGRGWISRKFTIGGSAADVSAVANQLIAWAKRIDAEAATD